MALEIAKKRVANLNDRTDYVIHINHGLILKNVHGVIKFNEKAWLKPYIDMNSKLRQKAKTSFGKYLFNSMKIAVFGKNMEKVRKREVLNLTQQKGGNIISLFM